MEGEKVEAAGASGDRINAASYDGMSVAFERLGSVKDLQDYIAVHSGAQIWIDVRAGDLDAALKALGEEVPEKGVLIHDDERESKTVLAYPHTVLGSYGVHRTVVIARGLDVLITVHDSPGATDAKLAVTEYLEALVEKELMSEHSPRMELRDLVLSSVLESQAEEYIATMRGVIKDLSKLNVDIEQGKREPKAVQSELFGIHLFVEDRFPGALLAFHELVAKLRMGAGKNVDLRRWHQNLEDVLKDVDDAFGIKANVEKTVDLVSSTLRMKLTEHSIETQRRLQLAVLILTRVSILLFLPNMVFVFWRLTPWHDENAFELLGAEVHFFWVSVVVAAVLTVVAYTWINRFLKRHITQPLEEELSGF